MSTSIAHRDCTAMVDPNPLQILWKLLGWYLGLLVLVWLLERPREHLLEHFLLLETVGGAAGLLTGRWGGSVGIIVGEVNDFVMKIAGVS